MFHVSFGGLGALFGGISPPKPPWRRDCVNCQCVNDNLIFGPRSCSCF